MCSLKVELSIKGSSVKDSSSQSTSGRTAVEKDRKEKPWRNRCMFVGSQSELRT